MLELIAKILNVMASIRILSSVQCHFQSLWNLDGPREIYGEFMCLLTLTPKKKKQLVELAIWKVQSGENMLCHKMASVLPEQEVSVFLGSFYL